MKVRLCFFGALRELLQCDDREFDLPDGMMAGDLVSYLKLNVARLAAFNGGLLVAINHEHAPNGRELSDGDEVALMPPFAGG